MAIYSRTVCFNLIPSAKRGFTLIELLVVIAIIGLLSSVVLASLSSSRLRANDATIRQEAIQLRNVFELEYSETGNYTNIIQGGGWWMTGQSCSGASGNYGSKATAICNAMVRAAGSVCGYGGYCVYFNNVSVPDPSKYTIMAYLPYQSAKTGQPMYICIGSSGATSITNGVTNGVAWGDPGCWANP